MIVNNVLVLYIKNFTGTRPLQEPQHFVRSIHVMPVRKKLMMRRKKLMMRIKLVKKLLHLMTKTSMLSVQAVI
uniref:Uncharacterized protein n=1 Tax=Romanomermis culicivorax TaxID=13658 RepID=A0A915HTK4_ROMCU